MGHPRLLSLSLFWCCLSVSAFSYSFHSFPTHALFTSPSPPSPWRILFQGVITPTTPTTSSPSKDTKFLDPLSPILAAVKKLQTQESVDKIILLSHLGFPEDVALAPSLTGIDVIVGGHVPLFLSLFFHVTHTLIIDAYLPRPESIPTYCKGCWWKHCVYRTGKVLGWVSGTLAC